MHANFSAEEDHGQEDTGRGLNFFIRFGNYPPQIWSEVLECGIARDVLRDAIYALFTIPIYINKRGKMVRN
jgi:hypothetical protein